MADRAEHYLEAEERVVLARTAHGLDERDAVRLIAEANVHALLASAPIGVAEAADAIAQQRGYARDWAGRLVQHRTEVERRFAEAERPITDG